MNCNVPVLFAISLVANCCFAQSEFPSGINPLDAAIADAGLFVLQLNLDGALSEFSDANSPSARLDEGDPGNSHLAGADIRYPFTAAMHFLAVIRSETATAIVAPDPIYHVRIHKESATAPWQMKEFWKIKDGARSDLPIPPMEAQLQANARISSTANSPSTPAAPVKAPSQKLSKIPCPRCKGEEGPVSTCPFCRQRGYIWVDAPASAQTGQIH